MHDPAASGNKSPFVRDDFLFTLVTLKCYHYHFVVLGLYQGRFMQRDLHGANWLWHGHKSHVRLFWLWSMEKNSKSTWRVLWILHPAEFN